MTFQKHDYTLIASESEFQIVVIASPGQSGHWFLHIVVVACDGGFSGLKTPYKNFPYGQLDDKQVVAKVESSVNELMKNNNYGKKIATEFARFWFGAKVATEFSKLTTA